jgi:Cysteine rich repeat
VRGLFGSKMEQTPAVGGRPLAPRPESARRLAVSDLSRERGEATGRDKFMLTLKLRIAKLAFVFLLLLTPAGAMAQQGAVHQACAADLKQMCGEVKPGDGRLKSCIKEHFGQLSPPCQTALLSNVTITKSCKADAEQKCSGIQPGGGRIQTCMKDHFTELTEPCKEALLLAKLQQQ